MSNRIVLLALAGLGVFTAAGTIGCAEHHHMDSDEKCEHCEKHAEAADKEKKEEKEDKVALDKIPQAVVDTVKKEVPDGAITDAELEKKDGTNVYEMDVKFGEIVYEMKVSADGKFISKEVDNEKDEKDEKDKK